MILLRAMILPQTVVLTAFPHRATFFRWIAQMVATPDRPPDGQAPARLAPDRLDRPNLEGDCWVLKGGSKYCQAVDDIVQRTIKICLASQLEETDVCGGSLDSAAKEIANEAFKELINSPRRYIEVVFTGDRYKALKAIRELEDDAITVVSQRLRDDLGQISPFPWDAAAALRREAAKQHAREIKQWEQRARSEAASGSNWRTYTNDYRDDRHIYFLSPTFDEGVKIDHGIQGHNFDGGNF